MDLKEVIQNYLPQIPELVTLLKQKFGSEQKTFSSDGGELIYEGELSAGTSVYVDFDKEMEDCMKKKIEAGKTKDEAHKMCMSSGKMERIPAPTKTYKHADGTEVVVESGKVVDIKKPAAPASDFKKEFVEELFKAFPKTDLTGIEATLSELKATLASIQAEKTELKAKVDKFENFKNEVIVILEKFSTDPSAKPIMRPKTDSTKSIFSAETLEEKIKALNSIEN